MTPVRILLAASIVALVVGSVACGGPKGCSTAIPGQSGGTSGGASGGSSSPVGSCVLQNGSSVATGIYLFIADAGGIQGEFVDTVNKKMTITPNFGTVSTPTTKGVPGDWMVIAQRKFLYSAYTSSGEIYAWSISNAGLLTALSPPVASAAYLTNNNNGGTTFAGMQAMITNPTGTLLFVLDQTSGNDAVQVYQIGAAGLLSTPTTYPLPSGFVPFNLAIDGQGKFLYVSDGGSGGNTTQAVGYSITGTTLTPLANSPFAFNLQQMQGEATGKFMFGTSGGNFATDNHIYVASINASTGALTETATQTVGFPVSVAVQANSGGKIVYVVDSPNGSNGGLDGPIEGFTFDSSGTLTQMANSPFSATGTTAEFDSSGQFFFLASNTHAAHVALFAYDTIATPDLSTALGSTGWSPGAWQSFVP